MYFKATQVLMFLSKDMLQTSSKRKMAIVLLSYLVLSVRNPIKMENCKMMTVCFWSRELQNKTQKLSSLQIFLKEKNMVCSPWLELLYL